VRSIVKNPNTDPHDYEPTAADARLLARARYVLYNGIGYDPWVPKLLAANPVGGRLVLDLGELLGVPADGNPHRWYSPNDVGKVIGRITADYRRLAPADAAEFDRLHDDLVFNRMARYQSLVAGIRDRFSGTPVGASESIFSPMAESLGLELLTPPGFLAAVSEGREPTAADKATIDSQIKGRQVKVYVFNSQNATPDVRAQVAEAKAVGIPVTSVTETLVPADATFEDWQSRQLEGLEAALAKATGK
jgi:zinc/manganese transport system substrate-binding protein